jgi:hypothetical protein
MAHKNSRATPEFTSQIIDRYDIFVGDRKKIRENSRFIGNFPNSVRRWRATRASWSARLSMQI